MSNDNKKDDETTKKVNKCILDISINVIFDKVKGNAQQ